MADSLFDDFGDPSGQEDLARGHDLDQLFVETRGIQHFLARDPSHHVIVGSKGTGKSLLLFKKAVATARKPGVIVAPPPPRRSYTPTGAYADAKGWLHHWALEDSDGRPRVDQWARLWIWALYASVLCNWNTNAPDTFREAGLESWWKGSIDDPNEHNPFDLIGRYLTHIETRTRHHKGRLQMPDAAPLKHLVLHNVHRFPTTYLFLDNQDDFFFEAPEYWKASGFGCFLAMRELRQDTNHRVHVFMTLRPEVVWELEKSQHFAQWRGDIFYLRWNDDDLLRVFASRAARLKPELLPNPERVATDPFGAFMGRRYFDADADDYVFRVPLVETAGGEERRCSLKQYLLRHSLRRPREMVLLGNAILDARRANEDPSGAAAVGDTEILRNALDTEAATVIANSYIGEVKHRWPWGHPPDEALRGFLHEYLNHNIVSAAEARAIEKQYARTLGKPPDQVRVFSTLGALGLVGWPVQRAGENGSRVQRFILPGEENQPAVPGWAQWYLVHPILYGPPYNIEVIPGLLVGPGLEFHETGAGISTSPYYSCFISYGTPDEDFARRLRGRLESAGVRCWLSCEDAVPGDKTWEAIDVQLQRSARMLVVCSAASLVREGVQRELVKQIVRAPKAIIPLSLDEVWRARSFVVSREGHDLKSALMDRFRVDFHALEFDEGFQRLLGALTKRRRKPRRKSSVSEPAATAGA